MNEQPPQGPRKHRRTAAWTVFAGAAGLIALIVILGVTGHDSPASTAAPPQAAPSSSALAAPPSPAASQEPCTTHSCIVADAKGLVGSVAKDESVLTAMSCYSSTVKHAAPGVWTVHCLATYSDGSQWDGIASVLISANRVTWEPTQETR